MEMRFLNILVLLVCSFSANGADWQKRPMVIGASVADGFDVSEYYNLFIHPKSEKLAFDKALNEILDDHESIPNAGTRTFFMKVRRSGRSQVKQALKHECSAVFAVDFLFWYLYGNFKEDTDQARLRRFEEGLTQLDRIKCPILVGDLPNAQAAVGKILSKSQMPSQRALGRANARLLEWSVTRPHVKIISLATFLRQASQDGEIKIGDVTVPKGQSRRLLQNDLLHPNKLGVETLAKAAVSLLKAAE